MGNTGQIRKFLEFWRFFQISSPKDEFLRLFDASHKTSQVKKFEYSWMESPTRKLVWPFG
jgi:hypothetical protein